MGTVYQVIAIMCSYLLGAVPFGLIFSRILAHIDVRSVGSGNIGATNVLRAAGKKAAILTLLADALKGYVSVFVAQLLFNDDYITVLAGAAAILGHNFPVYLKFKGGKGVATSYGVMLAASPLIGLLSLLVWPLVALIWRYSSLAALVSIASYPLLIFGTASSPSKPYELLSVFIFALIYYRHRENIKRLLDGTEPKIGKK
jgi:acyl phosphate:glycerol-3-phosphate acyltransferase